MSRIHSISYGLPQESVLGPILFLLYVNDLPNVSKFKTTLFADDINLHLSHSNISLLQNGSFAGNDCSRFMAEEKYAEFSSVQFSSIYSPHYASMDTSKSINTSFGKKK